MRSKAPASRRTPYASRDLVSALLLFVSPPSNFGLRFSLGLTTFGFRILALPIANLSSHGPPQPLPCLIVGSTLYDLIPRDQHPGNDVLLGPLLQYTDQKQLQL